MNRTIQGLGMAALLVGVCSGCQTFGPQTAGIARLGTTEYRAQSPAVADASWAETAPESGVTPAGHYHTPIRSAATEIQDAMSQHHSTDVYSGQVPAGAQSCPPQGYGNCPPQGNGNCPPGGHQACRQDRYSYNYLVPNNLVYPQPNAVGGAMVYPYYTHRGPSDFFRAE